MFACIYGRNVSKAADSAALDSQRSATLVDLAFTFSPLVEQTTADTVVLDISGQDLLFGLKVRSGENATADPEINSARNISAEIYRRGQCLGLNINVATAANPDASVHAARSFKGITVIDSGEELSKLSNLSIKKLSFSLAAIDEKRAAEMQEPLALWGIRTFGDLARLPLAGVAERLGQDGVRLQKLAQGKTDRNLNLLRPPIGFEQSLELEHPVSELEPLSFILSRLLNQLCANLHEYALATNELHLRLMPEPGVLSNSENKTQLLKRAITLPVPIGNPKTLLRLLLFEIEREPPPAPIIAVTLSAEPVKPRALQTGLFIPLAPEPERLEVTLARLAKLVGADNVGSPEILDSHRPDAFQMKRFSLAAANRRKRSHPLSAMRNAQCAMGFRIFRPSWNAEVQITRGKPRRINARGYQLSARIRGQIICAAGPWRVSGDWWDGDLWARDEWDVAVIDQASSEGEILCRIYRDLTNEQWFLAGIYD